MKSWEIVWCTSKDESHFVAMLYEQPLIRWLIGKITYRIWMKSPKWVYNHHGERWLLRYELWMTWDLPHKGRRDIEEVPVAERDKDSTHWDRFADGTEPPKYLPRHSREPIAAIDIEEFDDGAPIDDPDPMS